MCSFTCFFYFFRYLFDFWSIFIVFFKILAHFPHYRLKYVSSHIFSTQDITKAQFCCEKTHLVQFSAFFLQAFNSLFLLSFEIVSFLVTIYHFNTLWTHLAVTCIYFAYLSFISLSSLKLHFIHFDFTYFFTI